MSRARGWFQHPKVGSRQGVMHRPVRGQFVGMSRAVCLLCAADLSAFRADCEDVSSEGLVSAPQGGAAKGCCTGPFAARLWGCLERFACFAPRTCLLSEEIVRMHGPVRGQIVGFACFAPRTSAFSTDCEDVSSEGLISAPQGRDSQRYAEIFSRIFKIFKIILNPSRKSSKYSNIF